MFDLYELPEERNMRLAKTMSFRRTGYRPHEAHSDLWEIAKTRQITKDYLMVALTSASTGEQRFWYQPIHHYRRLLLKELYHLSDQDVASYVQANFRTVFDQMKKASLGCLKYGGPEDYDGPVVFDDATCEVSILGEGYVDEDGCLDEDNLPENQRTTDDYRTGEYHEDYCFSDEIDTRWRCLIMSAHYGEDPMRESLLTYINLDRVCFELDIHPLDLKEGFISPQAYEEGLVASDYDLISVEEFFSTTEDSEVDESTGVETAIVTTDLVGFKKLMNEWAEHHPIDIGESRNVLEFYSRVRD